MCQEINIQRAHRSTSDLLPTQPFPDNENEENILAFAVPCQPITFIQGLAFSRATVAQSPSLTTNSFSQNKQENSRVAQAPTFCTPFMAA